MAPARVLAEANNTFALAMYEQCRRQAGNLVFSPFSIHTALAMALVGARGETATQMRAVLSMASWDEGEQGFSAELLQRLGGSGGGKCEIAVANSLWGQVGVALLPEFLAEIARDYCGVMKLVDFRHSTEAARVAVNQWVEERTSSKIRDLIPPGGLNSDTRLVVVNALHFKGEWADPFFDGATRVEPFYLHAGGTVQASLMHQTMRVAYVRAQGFQAVDLAYRGDELSMLVLLPDRRNELQTFERSLCARMLRDCVTQMENQSVEIFLPRFTITWGAVELSSQLAALGMTLPLDKMRANFSGINGHEPPSEEALFFSEIFHKAFVETNEAGTEASAATALLVSCTMNLNPPKPPPVPIFRADHPFLFAIRDRKTGTILFLGRVADPTRES